MLAASRAQCEGGAWDGQKLNQGIRQWDTTLGFLAGLCWALGPGSQGSPLHRR